MRANVGSSCPRTSHQRAPDDKLGPPTRAFSAREFCASCKAIGSSVHPLSVVTSIFPFCGKSADLRMPVQIFHAPNGSTAAAVDELNSSFHSLGLISSTYTYLRKRPLLLCSWGYAYPGGVSQGLHVCNTTGHPSLKSTSKKSSGCPAPESSPVSPAVLRMLCTHVPCRASRA